MPRVSRIQNTLHKKLNYLTQYQKDITLAALTGDYKTYKETLPKYAALAVNNKPLLEHLPNSKVNVPLFSKEGLNILKVMLLNIFRKKSPAEKELKQYSKRINLEKKYL